MPLSEHVYCVAIAYKMTEQVEQICIKFCVKPEHSPHRNYLYDSKGHSYGQLVVGSFIMTMCLFTSCLMQSSLAKHQITQVTQPPYSPDLVPCDFWLFPKLKPPLKEKRFQTIDMIWQNTTRQLMVIGRTV